MNKKILPNDFEYHSTTTVSSVYHINQESVQLNINDDEEALRDVMMHCNNREDDLYGWLDDLLDDAYDKHNIESLEFVQPVTDVENRNSFTPMLPVTEEMLAISTSEIDWVKELILVYFTQKYTNAKLKKYDEIEINPTKTLKELLQKVD
jgi:hypothetical protein